MELVCWCGRRNIGAYSRALQGCPHESVSHKCAGEPWRAMESHNTSRLLQTCLTRVSQQYLTICPTRPRASHKSFCQEHLQGAVPFFPRKYLSFMRSCAIFLWDIIEGKSLFPPGSQLPSCWQTCTASSSPAELAEKWLKCVVVLAKRNLNQCVGFPPLAAKVKLPTSFPSSRQKKQARHGKTIVPGFLVCRFTCVVLVAVDFWYVRAGMCYCSMCVPSSHILVLRGHGGHRRFCSES